MIYVVTAVHNRFDITRKFINILNKQTCKDIKLVIIDDGSTDGTSDMVNNMMPNSIIIQGDGNLWWGGSMHLAYQWLKLNASKDSYVMFANDDTFFDSSYIETALGILKNEPGILLTGCGYSVRTGRLLDGALKWNFKKGICESGPIADGEGNCASTRSLFATVDSVLKIGGFHPTLLPHYASDYEWTIRASRKGICIKSYPYLKYYFDENTTGDNDINNISLRTLFSKRSNMNPFYRLSFIVLSTPARYIPIHIMHQLSRYVRKIRNI